MKLKTLAKGTVLGLLACFTMIAAHAQSTLYFSVPFDFSVGGKIAPAGEYKVSVTSGNDLVVIRGADYKGVAMLFGHPFESRQVAGVAYLTFKHLGDTYFLTRICAGNERGIELPSSRAEKEYVAKAATPVLLRAHR